MRKKIMIGCLLAVFLMIMLPSAYAVESNAAKESMKLQTPIAIPEIDVEELKAKYTNDYSEPTCILLSVLIWFLRLIRKGILLSGFAALLVIFLIIRKLTNRTACAFS